MQFSLSFLVIFLKLHVTGAFQIRLSGGPNLCVGRVEVLYKGEWGTVCDDDWDLRDVAVVCRELNCGEALSAPHGAWFGEGAGSIWLNEVHCLGTERHLLSCHHLGFRKHVCTHEEDASAICSEQRFPLFTAIPTHTLFKMGKVEPITTIRPLVSPTFTEETHVLRLVGGRSQCSGRLEVFHEGQWGTVCDDMWDLLDVAVICRELDCGEALAAPGGAFFGEGSSVVWLDDVQCKGEESKLSDCRTSPWGRNNCRHSEDAGAVCSGEMPLAIIEEHMIMLTRTLAPQRSWSVVPKQIPHPIQLPRNQEETVTSQEHTENIPKGGLSESGQWQLRLVDGPGSCAGRVEVLYKDQWGTVCDDGWDLVDAAVVCRELSCGAPLLSPGNARYGPGSGPIWLDDVNCTGREFTIQRCRSQPWGKHNCNHHEDASVICTGRWKRLFFQKPSGNPKTTKSISTTQDPGSLNNSELQNVMTVIETTTNIHEFPNESDIKSLNQQYTNNPFLTTQSVKSEKVKKETKPANPSDIVETILSPKILQHMQERESANFPKATLSAHKQEKESISSSEKIQPTSLIWYAESKSETKSTTPGLVEKTVSNSEDTQHVQEMESTISSKIGSLLHKWGQMPISPSTEFQPLTTRNIESDREIELERPSGAEPPLFAQSFNSATEMVPPVYGDSNTEMFPVKKNIEFNDVFTQSQYITTATWVQAPEKVTKTSDYVTNELFQFSKSFDVTKEVELPTTTQNLHPEKHKETTTPKVIDSEENSNQEQKQSNVDAHHVEPTESTFISNDVLNSNELYPSPGTYTVSMNGQLEDSLFHSEGTARKTSLNKTGPNVTSAKPVTYSEHCESSPDYLVKQEQRKEDQSCCCSPPALGNLVHAMEDLHGELGALSIAIKNQGSQLEAVAHSLAELAASVRHLVGVLPSLVQPVSSQSFSAPSRQDESQLQNQLPLK